MEDEIRDLIVKAFDCGFANATDTWNGSCVNMSSEAYVSWREEEVNKILERKG